ncbi:hypothetical protein RJ639_037399 [Escallonia herrerae]|uniref:Uncharacterized protein n=1 Tax=Escallonia herrerae TaxID=1293975 RepID=A0AA88WNX0_9ASTE|nr:hypothetical protein RJ639_037399 [Escallonia herrerae]
MAQIREDITLIIGPVLRPAPPLNMPKHGCLKMLDKKNMNGNDTIRHTQSRTHGITQSYPNFEELSDEELTEGEFPKPEGEKTDNYADIKGSDSHLEGQEGAGICSSNLKRMCMISTEKILKCFKFSINHFDPGSDQGSVEEALTYFCQSQSLSQLTLLRVHGVRCCFGLPNHKEKDNSTPQLLKIANPSFDGNAFLDWGRMRWWKMQVEDYLYQKDLYLPLVGEKPEAMNASEWAILDRNALATVRLSLTPQVAFNISKEKTTAAVMKALEKLYEKPSANLRLGKPKINKQFERDLGKLFKSNSSTPVFPVR